MLSLREGGGARAKSLLRSPRKRLQYVGPEARLILRPQAATSSLSLLQRPVHISTFNDSLLPSHTARCDVRMVDQCCLRQIGKLSERQVKHSHTHLLPIYDALKCLLINPQHHKDVRVCVHNSRDQSPINRFEIPTSLKSLTSFNYCAAHRLIH